MNRKKARHVPSFFDLPHRLAAGRIVGFEFRQFHRSDRYPALFAVFNDNGCINAAADPPFCFQTHVARLQSLDEIVQNFVGDGFMEGAFPDDSSTYRA